MLGAESTAPCTQSTQAISKLKIRHKTKHKKTQHDILLHPDWHQFFMLIYWLVGD